MLIESVIKNLPDNPFLALEKIHDAFRALDEAASSEFGYDTDYYAAFIEYYAFLAKFSQMKCKTLSVPFLTLVGDKTDNMEAIAEFLDQVSASATKLFSEDQIGSAMARFEFMLQKGFVYEFSDGDLERIQKLINEIRDLAVATDTLPDEHKGRILRKLEKLQSELHKTMPDLDRFWGLIGEAGVIFGKFGKDSKPMVDRIRELVEIARRSQSRAEELPSDSTPPLLKSD